MTFLPIAVRELRVAARKRSTFWLRIAAALAGLLIGAGFLIISQLLGLGSAAFGGALFKTLTWLSLATALSAGLFFTADSLSEEKREGTLGFLFLTDLRGYDIASGKLLATSLRGSYALLAFLPVLATTLLMGGVTGAQFWKTVLALLDALLYSLAGGMLISALSRDSQRALLGTLLLLLLLVGGAPALDSAIAAVRKLPFRPQFSLISPAYAFISAEAWRRTPYWLGLVLSWLTACLLLGLSCVLVPRVWQERSRRPAGPGSWGRFWKYGGVRRQKRIRRKLLDRNPAYWLACRERWQVLGLWMVAVLLLGLCAMIAAALPAPAWMICTQLTGFVILGVYLWVASQACRFFVEVRRNGFLELLLVTPLPVRQIVQAHWLVWLRMFGLPILLLVGFQATGTLLTQLGMRSMMASVSSSTSKSGGVPATTVVIGGSGTSVTNPATSAASAAPPPVYPVWSAVALSVTSGISTAANLAALVWFGMWMGMTSKNASLATLKTIAFAQLIPVAAISFLSGLVAVAVMMLGLYKSGSPPSMGIAVTFPLIVSGLVALLSVGKDIGFVVWSQRRLHERFRDQATRPIIPVLAAPPLPVQS